MDDVTIWRDLPLPPTRTVEEKVWALCLSGPLEFHAASFWDAVNYLRQLGYELDVEEGDEQAQGVSVWIGVADGAPLILGEPGESRDLGRWLGKLRFTWNFPAGTCLGSVWHTLAFHFGLEMRLYEEGGRLILWLSSALPINYL